VFRLAALSLLTAILLAVFGLTGLAGDFGWLALGLFAFALMSSAWFAGLGAMESRDAHRCYN
jgi:hypothetical protein